MPGEPPQDHPEAPQPQPPPRRRPASRPNNFAQPAENLPIDPVVSLANRGLREDANALAVPDQTLDLVDATVARLTEGEDLTQRLRGREEKQWVLDSLVQDDDFRRVAEFLRVRRRSEAYLLRMFNRGAMNVQDAMTFARLAEDNIQRIRSTLRGPKQPGQDGAKFTETVVEKLELTDGTKAERRVQRTVQATWDENDGTTPQGREIVRRKLYAMQKKMREAAAAREAQETPES